MRRRRAPAGFTLFEMVIVGALTLLLGALVAQVVRPVLAVMSDASVRTRLQQDALVTMNRLEADVRMSATAGIGIRPAHVSGDPVMAAIHRLKDTPFQGGPQWEDRLVVYVWQPGAGTLVRKQWPPAPPMSGLVLPTTSPVSCPPDELLAIGVATNGSERIMARHVTSFEMVSGGSGAFSVRVRLEEDLDSRRKESFETTRTIYARNHF